MFKWIRAKRPSAAMVVAVIALFVSFGGAAIGKQVLPLIDGHRITPHSIDANRLTIAARKALQGPAGQSGQNGSRGAAGVAGAAGAAGAKGDAGAPGAPGTAVAYVEVLMTNAGITVETAKNISQSQVSLATGNAGVICFHDLGFSVKSMVASPVAIYGFANDNQTFVSVGPRSTASGCPSGSFDTEGFISAWDVAPIGGAPRLFTGRVEVWFQ